MDDDFDAIELELDLLCRRQQPYFGELFLMLTGAEHPDFPADDSPFPDASALGFRQAGDFWTLPSQRPVGDSEIMWLYPIRDGDEMVHDPGPFDGVRLAYNVLRNPADHVEVYLETATALTRALNARMIYRGQVIGGLAPVETEAGRIIAYWREQGIEPGSDEALLVDY